MNATKHVEGVVFRGREIGAGLLVAVLCSGTGAAAGALGTSRPATERLDRIEQTLSRIDERTKHLDKIEERLGNTETDLAALKERTKPHGNEPR